ncbi:hypothetical protein [Actinacidiphila glaucinigra]|uniref:Lipoprotein n=1 Tax=Actinacidiphila glaucinigra TaxID=235986 RepID=A0A239ERW6_9ACTN|nr:hypothetical protein [Actinacidiphila glaucinigra]SNS47426.1 hypothetical protein SAMN05216252_106125 [Actinacidiphila glaucinigra]
MILGRRSSVLVSLLGAALLLAGATGCAGDPDAGTNGVGKLPAETIEKRARTAADAADTVRLTGTVVSRGLTYTLDMRLRGNGGLGEVTSKGSTFELLRVGDDLYLKAGAGFYGDQVGAKLKNKYVKVPAADPAYDQFSGFTDKEVLLEGLFVLRGALTVGDHRTVGGVRTIAVSADGGDGGTIDVSLEGKPYPLRYERAGGAGTLTMDDWGKDFTLRAPDEDDVVDYGKTVTQ